MIAKRPDNCRDQYGGLTRIRAKATGFFRVEQLNGRWWLITPDGHGFLSVGVNHVDYKEDYSPEFVKFVCSHLLGWGFNTIGWSQEAMSSEFVKGRVTHSRGWGQEQYKYVDLPYIHLLRFTDMEWYANEEFPDVFSSAFADKCDSIAREFCTQMCDDPKLMGYFYSDTPNWPKWAHITAHNLQKKLDRLNFQNLASQYYQVIHDAIQRYDKNHLLFGDRYKGNQVILVSDAVTNGLPDCILEVMQGTVDVLSIEYFACFKTMQADLGYWYQFSGKPILLADSAFLAPTNTLKVRPEAEVYVPDQTARGLAYQYFARQAFSCPWIVGWHWCAFGCSQGRKSGLLDGEDRPYDECVNLMRTFNTHELYTVSTK